MGIASRFCKPHTLSVTLQFQELRLKTAWTLVPFHQSPSAPAATEGDQQSLLPERNEESPLPEPFPQQALQQTFTGPAVQMPPAVPSPDALEIDVLSPVATSSADALNNPTALQVRRHGYLSTLNVEEVVQRLMQNLEMPGWDYENRSIDDMVIHVFKHCLNACAW